MAAAAGLHVVVCWPTRETGKRTATSEVHIEDSDSCKGVQ
jgi:hypothetical protein